jgi:hypothetical protein
VYQELYSIKEVESKFLIFRELLKVQLVEKVEEKK